VACGCWTSRTGIGLGCPCFFRALYDYFCPFVLLELYILHLCCSVLMVPVQDQLFSFQDNFLATRSTSTISCMLFRQFVYLYFIGIDSHFKILDLCTFDSMLKTMGKSCTSSATSASPFLPGRYFFTWNARGNYSLSLEGIFSPLSNSTLQSETSGHEPCRASILLSYLHLLCFFGGLGSTLPYSTVSRV